MITREIAKDWLEISIDADDTIIDLLIEKAKDRLNDFLNTEYTAETAPAAVKGCALNLVAYYYDNRDSVKSKRTDGVESKEYRDEKEILEDCIDYRRQPWTGPRPTE